MKEQLSYRIQNRFLTCWYRFVCRRQITGLKNLHLGAPATLVLGIHRAHTPGRAFHPRRAMFSELPPWFYSAHGQQCNPYRHRSISLLLSGGYSNLSGRRARGRQRLLQQQLQNPVSQRNHYRRRMCDFPRCNQYGFGLSYAGRRRGTRLAGGDWQPCVDWQSCIDSKGGQNRRWCDNRIRRSRYERRASACRGCGRTCQGHKNRRGVEIKHELLAQERPMHRLCGLC